MLGYPQAPQMINLTARVYPLGHPNFMGTVVKGDEYCTFVTVKWDDGRTTRAANSKLGVLLRRPTHFIDTENGRHSIEYP